MKKYTSSPDQAATIIPYAMIGISLFSIGITFWASKRTDNPLLLLITTLPVFVILTGVVIAMYYMKTEAIEIDDTGITIVRKWKPVVIDFSEITAVQQVSKSEMGFVIRTFGNGGVFGYTGQFYNKKFGSMTWYCSRRDGFLIIEKTKGRKIVITLRVVERFLLMVRMITQEVPQR